MGKKEKTTKLISVMVSATLATGMVPAAAFAQQAIDATAQGDSASPEQGIENVDPTATEIAKATEAEAQQAAPTSSAQLLEAETPANPAMSGDCGATESDHVTWELTQNNTDSENPTYTLSISGTGAMTDWLEHRASGNNSCGTDASTSPDVCTNPKCALNRPWAAYLDKITQVKLGEGITRLGSESLTNIANVDSVVLPESLEAVGFGSMAGMASLSSIEIPDAVKAIETSAFYGDSSLATINFSESGNLEEIGGYAFSHAALSGKLSLPEGLKKIGLAPFERCNSVTEFVIPSTVESYALSNGGNNNFFNGANGSLRKVIIKSSADLPGYMFQGQGALEEVEIDGDVTSIGVSAFNGCKKLSSVSGTGSVKSIGNQAFRYDSGLTGIDLSGAESIGDWSFSESGLAGVDAPNAKTIGPALSRNAPTWLRSPWAGLRASRAGSSPATTVFRPSI